VGGRLDETANATNDQGFGVGSLGVEGEGTTAAQRGRASAVTAARHAARLRFEELIVDYCILGQDKWAKKVSPDSYFMYWDEAAGCLKPQRLQASGN
jgi:hypothetical protein